MKRGQEKKRGWFARSGGGEKDFESYSGNASLVLMQIDASKKKSSIEWPGGRGVGCFVQGNGDVHLRPGILRVSVRGVQRLKAVGRDGVKEKK